MPGFADPWVLLLLLVPLGIRLLPGRSAATGPALIVPDGIGRQLGGTGRTQTSAALGAWLVPILLWSALVVALAGPRQLLNHPTLPVTGRDLVLAQELGVRVHTIAMGPRDLSNADGERDAVDADTLKAIADLSGGGYFRAKTTADLQAVADAIDQLEAIPSDGPAALVYRPLWPWPAGLAALLALGLVLGPRR